MFVNVAEVAGSRHAKVACSQCHSEVNASKLRPCETITKAVDCSKCHEAVGQQYQRSTHGQLFAKQDTNAPTCRECHGTHGILGKADPQSATFPPNVPNLCARCHREGQRAAVRYTGTQHEIISNYSESIHGKGLLKSGLTVTATCTSCHTAHGELPAKDPESTVNSRNMPQTCGKCHHGIEEQFVQSVHSATVTKTDKPLPVCSDCHTAHSIRRADEDGFKLEIMDRCGRCHSEIAKSYFDTYHGKVSRLGYTKTAKCYDCHGAHDIQKVTDPRSHLSRDQRGCHLPEVPRRRHPPLCRIPDARDSSRSQEISVPVLGVLGHDIAADRDFCHQRRAYHVVAAARVRDAPPVARGRSSARGEAASGGG